MHTDEFEALLASSDPVGELTPRERQAVSVMVSRSVAAPRRRYAPVALTTLAAALLGGGSVAAAAAAGLWSPWAQNDPLVSIEYELPSGTSCEYRFGNIEGAPDEVDDVIRAALSRVKFSDADIIEGAQHVGVTGDPLTNDDAYETGLMWAVQIRIEEALEAHGLDDQWSSIDGEGFCS